MLPWAAGQTVIPVPEATPCWQRANQTGIDILRDCGLGTDYIQAATIGADWVTGGNLGMAVIGIVMLATYLKYHTAIYSLIVGVAFFPVAFFIFPTNFLTWALILTAITIGIVLWQVYVRQTRANIF